MVAMSSPEAAAAVAAALAGGGVRAELAPGRLADPAAVRPLALKSGRGVAAAVTGREQDEGLVRGAGLRMHADWIFSRGLKITRWGVARPLHVSDHWPIWAEVEL